MDMTNWSGDFEFRSPARIVFGVGTVERVGEIAKSLGSKTPLIVTDPILHEIGLTEGAEKSLKDAGLSVEVFSGIATEPTLESVENAVDAFRSADRDLIVALGGGSTIDSSKSVSLLLVNEGKLTEYHQSRVGTDWTPPRKIEKRGAHIISVPTTAGTGSEVTAGSGVFNPDTGIKGWAGDPILRPSVAICDPELNATMPPNVTADTGADALSQAMECYLVNRFKPTADTLAIKAIEVIGKYLPKAFANGQDIEARSAMLWSATTVGVAFGNGGLIHNHTYSEVLGDVTHLPHGRLLGIMLPHILDFNFPGCHEKLADIARALGEDIDGASTRDAAEMGVIAVNRLLEEIEMDDKLSNYGVTKAQLQTVAERVWAQYGPRSALSPRAFRTFDDVMDLLRQAY